MYSLNIEKAAMSVNNIDVSTSFGFYRSDQVGGCKYMHRTLHELEFVLQDGITDYGASCH